MKIKISAPSEFGICGFAKFPVVDVETIDDLKQKKICDLRPSIVGIFFQDKIKQYILYNLESYQKFRAEVTQELNLLPQPFLAFNNLFDKSVLKGFTGNAYKFGEIQEYHFQKKQKAKEKYGIIVDDPFNGDGYLAIVHYRKYLETRNEKHLELVVNHNIACLLTEYLLWERLISCKK
jgi:hypothetical protein